MKIELSAEEIQSRTWDPKTLEKAFELFKAHGFLTIGNLFQQEFIEELHTHYCSQLTFNEEGTEILNGAKVGHQRYLIPVEIKKPFNTPDLYANPFLIQLFRLLLGPYFRLSGMGSVTALPGAMDQHIHADYMPLFPEMKELGAIMPPYAITVILALVDVDFLNGPTKIWSGSHLMHPLDLEMHSYSRFLLCGKKGTCHLWDYRTFHAGGSNHSETLRPLLSMAYQRNWFQDLINPDELRISPEELQEVPLEHRELVSCSRYQTQARLCNSSRDARARKSSCTQLQRLQEEL